MNITQIAFLTPKTLQKNRKEVSFFLGETVIHTGNKQFYTVCDLSNYDDDYFGLWEENMKCAVPTHGSYGKFLLSISENLETKLLQ